MNDDEARGRVAQDEAQALVELLAGEGRKVLVVVLTVEGDCVALCRAATEGATAGDARGFVQGLDRERDRIASLLVRKS